MQSLIFASNNQHKVYEIKSVISGQYDIISLREAGIERDIPEPHNSPEENAREKGRVINTLTGKNCFSEDTVLEVDALNGEPGVLSARYAGIDKNDQANIQKLLYNLNGITDRKAQFRTVIFLLIDDSEYLFEGVCKGYITQTEQGSSGFGYDSIFMADGANKTFAEMEIEEKNLYSHRRKATDQLLAFLSHSGKKMSS